MAMSCAHCRSADVAALFSTWVCLTCGCHTTDMGDQTLPDSMLTAPNHDPALAQFGWPLDDPAVALDRSSEICSAQWGSVLTAEGAS